MASADVDKSGIYHVLAGPLDLTLFTHSFLGLGQDVAQQLSLQLAAETLAKPESLAQVCGATALYASGLKQTFQVSGVQGSFRASAFSA